MKAWVDDGLVDLDHAVVHVDDRGFTNGVGCFETMKVVEGAPFAITRHLARLRRSCAGLGIEPPGDDALRAACAAVVDANGAGVGRLRVMVTAGRGGLPPTPATGEPGLVVLSGPPRSLAPTATVAVGPWFRNDRSPLAGVKATSYAENAAALAWAAAHGADEVLFANTRGELCEGAGSNVFLVVDGRLRTPPLASGCLAGVTRDLVCELVDVDESPVPMEALAACSEAFLTSSTRDVQPVGALDGRGLAAPGPVTAEAQAAWRGLVGRTTDP